MKKFTLLIAMLFCILGYSQDKSVAPSSIKDSYIATHGVPTKKAVSQSLPYASFSEVPEEVYIGKARKAAAFTKKAVSKAAKVNTIARTSSDDPIVNALLERLSSLGNQAGSISDHFTQNEQIILRNHFAGKETKIFDANARVSGPLGNHNFTASTSAANRNVTTPVVPTRNPGVVITHSATQNITPLNSVTCNAGGIPTENHFYRDFDLTNDFGITGDFVVSDVEFAVEAVSGPVNLTLNIWSSVGAFPGGVLTLQGSSSYTSNVADALTVVSVPVAAIIPAGENMVYELVIDAGATASWFPGSNADGQTGPSYIAAADCGLPNPTDLAAIGFPNQHMVMNVIGKDDSGGGGGGGTPTAYGYESQTISFGSFESANPAVYTQIAGSPNDPGGNFEGAGAIDPSGDGSTGYAITTTTGTLYSIDLATGVYTSLGNITAPGGGSWVGLEFDPSTGTLYGLSGVFLSNVSLSVIDIGTVSATLVGTDNGSTAAVTFAIDGSGVGYLTDVVDDSLWSVDLATGSHTFVGLTGIDLNFGQGMTYDVNSDQIYTAAFNNILFTSEWRSVNTATGATTLVGAINVPNLTQMGWVGMPDAGGGGGGGNECTAGTFTDRAAFEAAFGGTLFNEDFAGGPGVITACDGPINSSGNSCYPAGEILDGIDVRSLVPTDPNADTVVIPVGALGNADVLVGPNTFVDVLQILFPNDDVSAFGVDIALPLIGGATNVDLSIYGASGLIETITVTVPNGATTVFAGYIAEENIASVEIASQGGGAEGELIANAAFGLCEGGGGGGGGGGDCSVTGPSNGLENGKSCTFELGRSVAHDIEVPADSDMTLESITPRVFIGAQGSGVNAAFVDVRVYADAGGQPGAEVASQLGLAPTSQTVVGSNFGFDVWAVELDIADIALPGQAGVPTTYWIGISVSATDGSNNFWENSTAGLIGFGEAYNDGLGGGFVIDSTLEGAYTFTASCEDIGGGVTFDDCEGALPIECGDSILGSTIGSTPDGAADCDTSTETGVWYKFVDDSGLPGDYVLTTCSANTDYDTKVSVYSGSCTNLICVVGNDDDPNCPNFQTTVEFSSDGATTYYILVHGFAGATGNFELSLECNLIPPPNDEIQNAIDLDEVGCPFTDENVAMPAATTEDGTPSNCDITGAAGVWYVFTPELDGFITGTISNPAGATLTILTVNNGPLAGNYSPVAASFGGPIPTDPLTQDAVVVTDDDVTGDPNDACDPVNNGGALNGKIAIIRRGSCEFGFKALAAQNEGAVAVVVVNNQPGDPIVMGGGAVGDQVTIPVVMISDVEGEPIVAELLDGNTVNMTLYSEGITGVSSVTFYTAPDETSTEDELVLVDWWQNQCLPSATATIPVVADQTYYCFVVNTGAVTDIIFDNCQLGTDSNEIEGFAYYPNPTNDIVNLSSVENIEQVALYNILGQKLMDLDVNATTTQLNVSHLAAGAYIMEVTVNGQRGTYKVIKR